MKCLGVTGAQRQRADPLGIKRLPAHRKFRFLCVVLRVLRWDKRQEADRQDSGSVLAVPFLALGNVELEAVRTGRVPRRAGDGEAKLLIGCPDVAIYR